MIDRVPCVIRLLPIPKPSVGFYDFDEYERLIQAAKSLDRTTHLIVLLGGDAGLRCGEMMALEWRDGAEGRPTSLRAAHGPIGRGASRVSSFTV